MDFELISITTTAHGFDFEADFEKPNALLYVRDAENWVQGHASIYDEDGNVVRATPTVCLDFTQGVVTRPQTREERAKLLLAAVLEADEESTKEA